MTEIEPPVVVGTLSGFGVTLDNSALTGPPDAGQPTGGTFRLNYRHATSRSLPHNADAAAQTETLIEMQQLDESITAEHQANPKAYANCRVCFPVSDRLGYERRFAWLRNARIEIRDRLYFAGQALRGRY